MAGGEYLMSTSTRARPVRFAAVCTAAIGAAAYGLARVARQRQEVRWRQTGEPLPRQLEDRKQAEEVVSEKVPSRRLQAALQRVRPLDATTDLDAAVKQTLTVLRALARDSAFEDDLDNRGIPLAAVGQAIKYALPGFQPSSFDFANLKGFLDHCIRQQTSFCLVESARDRHPALAMASRIPPGTKVIELTMVGSSSAQTPRRRTRGRPNFRSARRDA